MHLQLAKQLIKQHEGLELSVYVCPAGYMTFGYGRNLETKGLSKTEVIYALQNQRDPEALANRLLDNDLNECEQDLREFAFFHNANDPRLAACIDLRYNLGAAGFRRFRRFIAAMNVKDYSVAAHELESSLWFSQVGDRGPRLKKIIATGIIDG